MSDGNIRIKGRDKEIINDLKTIEEVRLAAVEKDIIDERTDKLEFSQMMQLIIPDDAEPIERPEDEMSWQNARDQKDEILRLAGENVAVHEVISYHTERFAEEIEINYE